MTAQLFITSKMSRQNGNSLTLFYLVVNAQSCTLGKDRLSTREVLAKILLIAHVSSNKYGVRDKEKNGRGGGGGGRIKKWRNVIF